jgi:hypothetical protein
MSGKNKPVDPKLKMARKWERLKKYMEEKPLTTYEEQKRKQPKTFDDPFPRH